MHRVGALSLLLTILGFAGCTPLEAPERSVRLVLITVDTLRHDALGAGPAEGAMRRTRALAKTGLVFRHGYAATASTQPTHASLLTGRHPWQHGVTRNGLVLPDSEDTLAEKLDRAGFTTRAVVASFPLDPAFGFSQGFDVYEADFEHQIPVATWQEAPVAGRRFYSLASTVTDRAIALLDDSPPGNEFLWLHYFDPHDPYGDAAGVRRLRTLELQALARRRSPKLGATLERASAHYWRDVEALDTSLARLFERLAQDRDDVETHIVFTADHGESFGEDGSLGHGQRLTPTEVRVPLFIVSEEVEPGVRRDAAGSVDVFSTLLALAGIEDETGSGRDLRRPVGPESAAAFGMRRSYAEPYRDARTNGSEVVLEGPWFYAARGGRILAGDPQQVLEDDDPARPVAGDEASAHRRLFATFADSLATTTPDERIDPETREALRALGYAP